MWLLVVVVVIAVILIWWANRSDPRAGGLPVEDATDDGLVMDDRTLPWSSVYEVRVLTRRSLSGTWFGFELMSEDAGLVTLDGGRGRGERFLSYAHHLPGFDHDAVREALTSRESGVVCYNR